MTIAWHLPLTTLCTPAMGEDSSDAGAATVVVERETSNVGTVGAFAVLEEGMNSPSIIDPSLTGAATTRVGGPALAPHVEEVGPSEGPFVW